MTADLVTETVLFVGAHYLTRVTATVADALRSGNGLEVRARLGHCIVAVGYLANDAFVFERRSGDLRLALATPDAEVDAVWRAFVAQAHRKCFGLDGEQCSD